MAKKLADIQNWIESSTDEFRGYFLGLLSSDGERLIKSINAEARVYIFSGIIRSYFLEKGNVRDIDIVIDGHIDLDKFLVNYKYIRNSFGGYKVQIGATIIDMWFLKRTWALMYQPILEFDLEKYLPNTAFFNFSSVVYSYDENKFYYSKDFLRFIRDRKIDLVYAPNANEALCVVNSLYYSSKLKMGLGNKLKKHLKSIFNKNIGRYEQVQTKHFSQVIYSEKELADWVSSL